MISDYEEVMRAASEVLCAKGYALIENGDYVAVFSSGSGFVVLEGERYNRGAFTIGVTKLWPAAAPEIFNVRLMMRVLGDNSVPSLINQLNFICSHEDSLFRERARHEEAYRRLNENF